MALGQEALRLLANEPRLTLTGIGFDGILAHNQLVFGRALFVHNVVLNTFLAWGAFGLLGIGIVVVYTLAKSTYLLYGFMSDRLQVSAIEVSLAVSCLLVVYAFQVYDAFIDKSLWIYIALMGAMAIQKTKRRRPARIQPEGARRPAAIGRSSDTLSAHSGSRDG